MLAGSQQEVGQLNQKKPSAHILPPALTREALKICFSRLRSCQSGCNVVFSNLWILYVSYSGGKSKRKPTTGRITCGLPSESLSQRVVYIFSGLRITSVVLCRSLSQQFSKHGYGGPVSPLRCHRASFTDGKTHKGLHALPVCSCCIGVITCKQLAYVEAVLAALRLTEVRPDLDLWGGESLWATTKC